jgi:hypothetical protein
VPLGTYAEEMKKLAASALNRAANAAKQADVSCNTLQVGDAPPLSSHHCNGHGQGLRSHCYGIAWPQRTIRDCSRQRDKQGADKHKNAGVGVSLNSVWPRPARCRGLP